MNRFRYLRCSILLTGIFVVLCFISLLFVRVLFLKSFDIFDLQSLDRIAVVFLFLLAGSVAGVVSIWLMFSRHGRYYIFREQIKIDEDQRDL